MRKAPFFSRYVEQQSPKDKPELAVKTNIKAGAGPVVRQTLKYPSDKDEQIYDL